MRPVLVILVVANVVFLGWNLVRRAAPPETRSSAEEREDAGAPGIALVSEIDWRELRERVGPAPEPASVVLGRADQDLEQDRSGRAAVATAGTGAPETILANPAAPPAADALSEDAGIALAEGPATPDPAPIEEAPSAPGAPPLTSPAAIDDRDERLCYSVGPLTTPEEVRAMTTWLRGQGATATLREDERRELALYWVFVPPLASREAATGLVERMRGQGLGDIYIIPRGDMANAISLGVYSRRASLDRRLQQLRSRGHEPSVAPRYRTMKASWFDAAFGSDFDFRASGFAEAFPAVEMSPGPCTTPEDVPAGIPADDAAEPGIDRVAGDPDTSYDPSAARPGFIYSGPATDPRSERP